MGTGPLIPASKDGPTHVDRPIDLALVDAWPRPRPRWRPIPTAERAATPVSRPDHGGQGRRRFGLCGHPRPDHDRLELRGGDAERHDPPSSDRRGRHQAGNGRRDRLRRDRGGERRPIFQGAHRQRRHVRRQLRRATRLREGRRRRRDSVERLHVPQSDRRHRQSGGRAETRPDRRCRTRRSSRPAARPAARRFRSAATSC